MSVRLSRDEAWSLLTEWVESESLRRHCMAVETAMRAYARARGDDEELWGVVGLLHDMDYAVSYTHLTLPTTERV